MMHKIPDDLIKEINQLLGIEGRPYSIFSGEGQIDTDCYQWGRHKSAPELFQSVSRQLQEAMAEAQSAQVRMPISFSDPMSRMRKYIRRKHPNLLKEYDDLVKDLEEADERIHNPSGLKRPSIPADLIKTTMKIEKRLKAEFGSANHFDIERYFNRIRELWDEEPEEVRERMEAFQPEVQAYIEAEEEFWRQKRDRLAQVRSILQGRPFFAYGNVIVAPVEDPFEILEMERTNGANYGLSTDAIVTELRKIDKEHGIDILDAGFDFVIFRLLNVPEGEDAESLGEQLLDLCPDLLEAPSDLSEKLELWWD
ncbi:MAG: DUF4253 domain-containing protein [Anaerolineales bacterium]|jgi:hypothetical protein